MGERARRRGRRPTGEQGQVLVWTVVLLPLLLALLGLVFDGGLLWAQFRRARWAADGAAVAAASEMDPAVFREEGRVELEDEALDAAIYYARQNDPGLQIEEVYVIDRVVYVDGWVETQPVFLGLFGVERLRLTVHGRERPEWGAIEGEGQ